MSYEIEVDGVAITVEKKKMKNIRGPTLFSSINREKQEFQGGFC